MIEILMDTLIDSLKILPFLFLTYLIIEYIGHKSSESLIFGLRKYGVPGGAILGSFPQCGFSVAAANFYSNKVISVGTLIAVFISTSDEAIPVILANSGSFEVVLKLIITKVGIAIIAGLVADFFFAKYFEGELQEDTGHNHHFHHPHGGIVRSAFEHTVRIFAFIVVTIFLMNLLVYLIGEENLSRVLLTGSILQPAVVGLFGFIPNCASSIIITQLYLSGSLSFGSAVAGLSTGAGVGLLVLFRVNKKVKENVKIMLFIYLMAVLFGSMINSSIFLRGIL